MPKQPRSDWSPVGAVGEEGGLGQPLPQKGGEDSALSSWGGGLGEALLWLIPLLPLALCGKREPGHTAEPQSRCLSLLTAVPGLLPRGWPLVGMVGTRSCTRWRGPVDSVCGNLPRGGRSCGFSEGIMRSSRPPWVRAE